jgi:hypothetical protein
MFLFVHGLGEETLFASSSFKRFEQVFTRSILSSFDIVQTWPDRLSQRTFPANQNSDLPIDLHHAESRLAGLHQCEGWTSKHRRISHSGLYISHQVAVVTSTSAYVQMRLSGKARLIELSEVKE